MIERRLIAAATRKIALFRGGPLQHCSHFSCSFFTNEMTSSGVIARE